MRHALIGLLTLAGAGLAEETRAITLDEYFFAMTDRERGAYITGFLDLFANDAARDPEYRACVGELGAMDLHRAIGDGVRSDPRLLGYDAAQWLLFEAARACNRPAARPAPAAAATGDDRAAARADRTRQPEDGERSAGMPLSGFEREPPAAPAAVVPAALWGGAAGVALGIAAALLSERRRKRWSSLGPAGGPSA